MPFSIIDFSFYYSIQYLFFCITQSIHCLLPGEVVGVLVVVVVVVGVVVVVVGVVVVVVDVVVVGVVFSVVGGIGGTTK